jgi:hypothetical protein
VTIRFINQRELWRGGSPAIGGLLDFVCDVHRLRLFGQILESTDSSQEMACQRDDVWTD